MGIGKRILVTCGLLSGIMISSFASALEPTWPAPLERVPVPDTPGQPVIVNRLQLDVSDRMQGALSGLVRDRMGFYWSHTDDAGAGPDRTVSLVKLHITPVAAEVLEVVPLRDEAGNPVSGSMLDPEDVAVAPDGTLWLVDERYPLIVQVSRNGQILRRVEPPARYAARRTGQGFEGTALSPDGNVLYVMLQSGLTTDADRTLTWLLAYDIARGTFREYRYQLDNPSAYSYPEGVTALTGANGLVALGPSTLLVLERDNKAGDLARVKRVYRISIPDQPTDVPLAKELVIDLHALGYRLEKLEGMAVPAPNTMVLVNDNDGDELNETQVWYLQW